LAENYAIVRSSLDASFNWGEEDEALVALELDQSMISALIEALAVAFVRNVDLIVRLAEL